MAVDWPTLADLANELRLVDTSDPELQISLSAAIGFLSGQCPDWTTPDLVPGFLPDELFEATELKASAYFRRRDSLDGTIGWNDQGVVRVGTKDPHFDELIAPYRAVVFA